jgi:putative membrane protein
MKMVIIKNNHMRINSFFEWLVYLFGHTLVLITISVLFKSLYIDDAYFGLYGLLATLIISILNVTIKPIIVLLTLPLTGLTLGMFYPFVNVLILKITDFILGSHFEIKGIWIAFFIALLISLMNMMMEFSIIKPILRRSEKI